MTDLTGRAAHYAFGENWSRFSQSIDDGKIAAATAGLQKLIPDLKGKSFLDIGCGSGIHSLAALKLGARKVLATDIDELCVASTEKLLRARQPIGSWQAKPISVFDLTPQREGTFDVVYSWGVLHHTGDMMRAVRCAASLVDRSGLFAFALYRRTHLDWFWKVEKRLYARSGAALQRLADNAFHYYSRAYAHLRGFADEQFDTSRGMEYWISISDWLGGYPYESILAPEVEAVMAELGFSKVVDFSGPKQLGILGSGCDEYVYRRT